MANYSLIDLPKLRLRSEGIDALRATLALWVMFSHLAPWAAFVGHGSALLSTAVSALTSLFQSSGQTHPAVLGFIVLSGYCIHRSGFRREGGSARQYAVRRFFRIWPVYFLACAVGIIAFAVSHTINPTFATALTGTDAISVKCVAVKLTGISALIPSLHTCSFEGNAPLTTVMVEMWLYAVYAAAIFLCFRRGFGTQFLVAVAAVFVCGTLYVARHPELAGWWHNGSLVAFLAYWWTGALFVDDRFFSMMRKYAIPLGVAWAGIALALHAQYTSSFLIIELQQLILAQLFGIGIAMLGNLDGMLVRASAVIGRAGYSIYAFHAPILVVALVAGAPWWLAAAIACSAGLAFHWLYERPLDEFGKRLVATAKSAATVTMTKAV